MNTSFFKTMDVRMLSGGWRGIIRCVIAFYLNSGVPVYLFSILLGSGAAIGLLWAGLQSHKDEAVMVVNAGLVALLGGLLAGRATYAAVHWSYFQLHKAEIPRLFLGGLSWPGALAGGILAVFVYAALVRRPAMHFLDALLPLAGTVAVGAWLGCWLDGCAYGPPIQAWWALPARNEWGTIARRVPVQLMGAVLILITVGLVDLYRPRLRIAGQAALLALFAFGVQMFCLSFLRADAVPAWLGLHLETWSALLLAACSLFVLLVLVLRDRTQRLRRPALDSSGEGAIEQDL